MAKYPETFNYIHDRFFELVKDFTSYQMTYVFGEKLQHENLWAFITSIAHEKYPEWNRDETILWPECGWEAREWARTQYWNMRIHENYTPMKLRARPTKRTQKLDL